MITDGFFHPNYSIGVTFRKIHTNGLQVYSMELEQYEKWNNLRSDDKTGIMIKLI